MKDIIYISGHKNPDTDSICSALAYAEFKNKTGSITAVPVRLGELNRETQFVLDYFDVKPPELIETVRAQIQDLKFDSVAPICPDISLKMAWSIMKKNNVKTLPVVDENDKLIGLASLSNITSSYMDIWDNNILSKSGTTLENIVETLSAKCIYVSEKINNLTGKIVVTAMQPESTREIIDEGDIVICGDREDAQEIILDCKASLMIITGKHEVTEKIIEKAKSIACSIIMTPYDTFTAARLIPQSVPVSYVMTKDNLVLFNNEDLVDEAREIMLKTRFRSYPVVDNNNKILGSISRYHLISKTKKKVILVDHNERTQSIPGLEDSELLEVIDHHRIGDIQTGSPIYFRNEPVGCTATIIASIFFENGIRPSKKIAGLLCSAIISDTLLFKSPTSTATDKLMLRRLAEIANIDPEKFAQDMFKAGTSLQGKTLDEIFNQDFKIFNIGSLKVGVGQVTTMDTEGFASMKKDMIKYMEHRANDENFNLLILMVTDLLKDGSELLVAGDEKYLINKAFNVQLKENCVYMPGLMSRKKQVIPPLTNAAAETK
ncbi:Cobalt-dependent inorganic pyrophosphatase [Clostridium liquoris]|uniref:inorganic diphosphatase n=1 Tax=Clostridium liquoris TaxID=1289519 RepID=A0A2T0B4A1_9CLOT|nr:putative manganese-dependent inorganic diphosphatase [Clostridium liquoris]PRR78716.1 Cobalt-dependent inorganic pyrophosphatase [Clostridium liquoris]